MENNSCNIHSIEDSQGRRTDEEEELCVDWTMLIVIQIVLKWCRRTPNNNNDNNIS